MPKRNVRGTLSPLQVAQRKLAAKASADKRRRQAGRSASASKKAKTHEFSGRSLVQSAVDKHGIHAQDSPEYKAGVKDLRKAQRHHKISQGQKPKSKPRKASPYQALSSQGHAPKAKSPTRTAQGPQSTGPQAFSKAMRPGGADPEGRKNRTYRRRATTKANNKGQAIMSGLKQKAKPTAADYRAHGARTAPSLLAHNAKQQRSARSYYRGQKTGTIPKPKKRNRRSS